MRGPARIGRGLLTDPERPIAFRFDGRRMQGLAGDTLASALLANGRRLTGRSFKYHRPRGILTAGPEEPCALVDVLGSAGREPNRLATTLELEEGLAAESQNRWPSLGWDLLAVNGLLSRFLPAGFYYKTFMAPAWGWERLYEPLIRRAAGLGRLEPKVGPHASPAEMVHDHAEVLVVGAGAAGLAAACRLGASGRSVILAEQDVTLGGGTLLDPRWSAWRERAEGVLAKLPNVRCLPRMTVLGAYGQGVFAALETLAPEEARRFGGLRERLRILRIGRVLLATGALERLVAFTGNDVPGVMLAGAALGYLKRYGVAVGGRPVFFLNSDEAYEAVFALNEAGVACAGIIDPRADSHGAERARERGLALETGAVVQAVHGRSGVRGVSIADRDGRPRRRLAADCVLVSGGYSPASSLASQAGATLDWNAAIAAFTPDLPPTAGRVAGGARGVLGLAAAAADGERAAEAILEDLGGAGVNARNSNIVRMDLGLPPDPPVEPPVDFPADPPADPPATAIDALWEVAGCGPAFVDLQNDVTAADVRLAYREGFEHVEHMKRYTTHGMGTDQGRIGGLVGAAILAQARGVPLAQVGQSKPRPYTQPVPLAALAGGEVREHYRPKRRLPLHAWHEAAGATFVAAGLWLRPLVYSRASGWEPVLREARQVRESVGITDVSSLGKIDVQGADAARFLDFIYANRFSTLPVGRARYGIMLREDGLMLDDGTTSRLGPEHFLVTTTTANAGAVLEHLEFHLQAVCPELDVRLTDVSDQWAQLAVAGPRSRAVIERIVSGLELTNAHFPFMAAAPARIAGVAGRVFRISFSGELAYELAVPAREAHRAWAALLQAGQPFGLLPYGLDALNTLRIEKGHVTGAELNGNTTADDLGFARMLKSEGDFIGRELWRRPGLTAPDRLKLIGVRPVDRNERLRNGAHLVTPQAPERSLGYVTSSTPSVSGEGWVGLALLSGGRERIGQRLLLVSPIHRQRIEVEITNPVSFDPEHPRVRA